MVCSAARFAKNRPTTHSPSVVLMKAVPHLREKSPIRQGCRSEIEEKVLPLLSEGGYVPLADGRVREDIPFENYAFYRKSLEEITHQSSVLILRRRRLSEPSS